MDDAMVDNPEKTTRLLAALKAAAPFDVELAPSLIEYLQAENVADADRMHHVAWDLSYAGDEGGIVCHLSRSEETGRALVVSLTHVRVPRSMPLAAAVLDYQKHRVKKSSRSRAGGSIEMAHAIIRAPCLTQNVTGQPSC